jgi:hypothetical protein
MEQFLKQQFGNRDIYRFNGHESHLLALSLPVNTIKVHNELYFVVDSDQSVTDLDVRIELIYSKDEQ